MANFWNTLIAAAAGLGSGFVGGWLSRWLELYKTRLRKSEFLFQKEFDAASEFLSLRPRLLPRYHFPEMEWSDTREDFACNFGKAEKELEGYLATHGAALNRKALDRLSNAIEQIALGKFQVSGDTVSGQGIDIADQVMKALEVVENELYQAVWSRLSR